MNPIPENAQASQGIESIRREVELKIGSEKEKYCPNVFPPPFPEQTRLRNILTSEPEPVEAIINYKNEPFLTRSIVSMLVGVGGIGKSFFIAVLSYLLAYGRNFGPLKPVSPLKILVLFVEDPKEEMLRRFWAVGKGDYPQGLYACSVAGKIGPLMQIENGHPVKTDHYQWLDETISNHPELDLLILDPKSRLYGLEENNNDHNTQWISNLESLAIKHNITILFTHHVSKDGQGKLNQTMGRGGQALYDGCRWVAGMIGMDDETAKKHQIEDPKQYIVFDLVKSNYTPLLPYPLFFKRDEYGIPHYTNIHTERTSKIANALCQVLQDQAAAGQEYSAREIIKQPAGKPVFDGVVEISGDIRRGVDLQSAIDFAMAQGWIRPAEVRAGKVPKVVLRVVSAGGEYKN